MTADALRYLKYVLVAGSAGLFDEDSIEITFAYHNGDEAILKAKRDTSSTACQRQPSPFSTSIRSLS